MLTEARGHHFLIRNVSNKKSTNLKGMWLRNENLAMEIFYI